MNFKKKLLAVAVGASLSVAAQAGNIFITGHDSDEHDNSAYMAAGLDYVLFGTASNNAGRAGKNIAYIGTDLSSSPTGISSAGYGVTYFSVSSFAGAFTGFDAIMVGSGGGSTAQAALAAASASFTTYFNAGGSIYVNTDESFGQSWYNFVPQFGAANNSISVSGIYGPTAAGSAIGLTQAIVDADITHSYYSGVDLSLFTVLEVTEQNNSGVPVGQIVAMGLRSGTIGGCGAGVFCGTVPEPASLALLGLGLVGLAAVRRRKSA